MGAFAQLVLVLTLAARPSPQPGVAQPAGSASAGPPCATCLAIVIPPAQLDALPAALNGLEILVDFTAGNVPPDVASLVSSRGGRFGLVVPLGAGLPPAALLAPVTTVLLDARRDTQSTDSLIFALRTASTAIRAAAATQVRILVEAAPERRALVQRQDGGYWDGVVDSDGPGAWRRGGGLTTVGDALRASRVGSRVLVNAAPDGGTTSAVLGGVAAAARWLDDTLVTADDAEIACGGVGGRLYRRSTTLDRVALLEGCAAAATIVTRPALPVERAQLSGDLALIRIAGADAGGVAEEARVAAPRRLTVEEIVARHQSTAARQRAAMRTLTSMGTLTVTFEAPGFPAPVTVASTTTIFQEGERVDLEQRDILVNGVAFRSMGTPKLPIIEPERVAAPPLAIALGDRYRYRLGGETVLAGVPVYAIDFVPSGSRETSFEGRAWISRDDFGIVRIEARQTALRGPVVSSAQTDEFTRLSSGEWVLTRSEIRQLYEGAAYRTPIHRVLVLPVHRVNDPDFANARRQAYASDHTILRDTPAGYRYVEGEARLAPEAMASSSGVASVIGAATSRVRTLAFGVIVDPNISTPLPFAGLSYVDFNLFGTGTQFNGFFGGTYGQLAFSVPSIRRTRWQLAGRAFGIASSYNDRAFVGGLEQYGRNVRQRPAAAAVWLVRPLTPRLSLRLGYDLDYTALARSEVTSPSFVTPADQVAHGLRVELTGQRAGWDGSVWWMGSRRTGWRPWGSPGSSDYRPKHGDFQRFGGSVTRSLALTPRVVAKVETAVMGGHDLDRFSRFAFGTFDNRLHGYPSALIRYDRGAVARGVVGWSAGRLFRVDGFADTAWVHDPGFSSRVSRFSGLGAALEAPAPLGTLVAVEWGYGIQGVNTSGSRGTQVFRISGYKVF